jgi:AcrR family transcriptional regulator
LETVTTNNRRGLRSREEILEAASRVMAERGYTATTLSVLAAETGLPKSAIYHHFQSKSGVLTAVMEHGWQGFYAAMRSVQADPPPGGTPRERLEWYLQRTGEAILSHQDFLRLHLILVLSAEADDAEVAGRVDHVRAEGREHMRRMIASSFAAEGPEIAERVAAELDYFGIAGFDGAFIALQADPARSMPAAMSSLAEAVAALGEARASALRTGS